MLGSKRTRVVVLVLCTLTAVTAFACFALPMYVIRPFRYQGASELQLALWFKQYGTWLSAGCAAVSVGCAAVIWLGSQRWRARCIASVGAFLAIGGAVIVHINV